MEQPRPPAGGAHLLAAGRTADVWALPGGRVLRRYRAGGDVRAEAEVMRHRADGRAPDPDRLPDAAALVAEAIRGR
ncbi:hypothetical protein [Micromonospora sp. NPDC049282]|uniref:hypothetical protein n=1 Tax=Micromonospora sp. NPDC049282 TaxID=3364269 RepID=UPI003723FC5D